MHTPEFLDHFQNPRHVGELPTPAQLVSVSNPICGDELRLSVRWDGERVAEAAFKTRGCTASIAAGSALTEWLVGRSRAQIGALRASDIDAALGGLPPESKHAASLCLDAVRAILRS